MEPVSSPNSNFSKIDKQNDIEYIMKVYNRLIEYNINNEEAKLRLADIKCRILRDLDNAYIMYDELENEL